MSSIQGGPGFPLLTQSMYQYMSTGSVHVEIEDENVPLQIKSLVNQVCSYVANICVLFNIVVIHLRANAECG